MKAGLLLGALFVPLLAGCLADGESTGNVDDALQGGELDLASTLYLDSSGFLLEEMPSESAQMLDWSWGEWFEGTTAPVWYGPELNRSYVITQAEVTIQYDTAQLNGHSNTRPPFTIWFGAGDSIIEHAFAAGPNPWQPGDVQTIVFDVDSLPVGGLVVEAGERPVLHVGHYYGDGQGQELVSAILGGSEASRIDWTVEPLALPETLSERVLDETMELNGGRCVAPLNPEGSAQADFTIEITDDMVGLDAVVTRNSGTGLGPDLDFYFTNPSGEDVAHAAGSASPEAIRLRLPNMEAIGPGTWGVHVYNCQPQASEFTLTVDILQAAN